MLQVYSVILSLHEEPRNAYKVCSLFTNILSGKSFWKERHHREGLVYLEEERLTPIRVYYLTKEFVNKETVFSCHLSELPFFPSFAQGEEYYPRAIKFRIEKVPESMNRMILHECVYFYQSGEILRSYVNKEYTDRMIRSKEKELGIRDPEHPSLDVSVRLYRTEFANYAFYLYLNLDDERRGKVKIPLEKTIIDMEQALSFYLQVVKVL
jgi:hypothetical protein